MKIAFAPLLGLLILAEPDAHAQTAVVYAGVNGGVDVLPRSAAGSVLGIQASVSRLPEFFDTVYSPGLVLAWGAFADAAYITHRDASRFSVGPQAAFNTGTLILAGLQTGFLTDVDHGRTLFGFSVAPALSFFPFVAFFWLYGRWDHEVSNDGRQDSFQIGLMAQLPLNIIWE
jgi:hypothetical protein